MKNTPRRVRRSPAPTQFEGVSDLVGFSFVQNTPRRVDASDPGSLVERGTFEIHPPSPVGHIFGQDELNARLTVRE